MKPSLSPNTAPLARFIQSPITLGVFLMITVYAGTIIYTQWKKEREWNARVVVREVDVRAARERHNALKARVAYAESEVGKEEYLRQSFDVAQHGEALIVLPETKKVSPTDTIAEPAPTLSWWQQLIAKILDI